MGADPDLADTRRHYAQKTPATRRAAAEWEYESSFATSLFADALAQSDPDYEAETGLEAGVLALTIDPLFAPALLTVGSLEYQLGRPEPAMELFLTLTKLPEDEPDLIEIVDKAGDFLIDAGDRDSALRLYKAAAAASPDTATYWAGIGYCLCKADRLEEGIGAYRRAVDLEPANAIWRNDLGWWLAEHGQLSEARSLLEQAVELTSGDYDLACGNLEIVQQRIREQEERSEKPEDEEGAR